MFQTKGDSSEDIFWGSVWSCVTLWVSNKSEFLRSDILGLSLKLVKFMSFKPKWILMKTFVESQFRVMWVYEFHTKRNSSEDISCASLWIDVSLWISNKSDFLLRHLLSLSLKLSRFTSFEQNRILMKTFVQSYFRLMWVYEFHTMGFIQKGILLKTFVESQFEIM